MITYIQQKGTTKQKSTDLYLFFSFNWNAPFQPKCYVETLCILLLSHDYECKTIPLKKGE